MSESAFIERALEPSVANADARFRSCDAEANGERRGDASFHARGSFASERVERAALPKKTMVSGHAPAPSDRSRARAPRLALGARFEAPGDTARPPRTPGGVGAARRRSRRSPSRASPSRRRPRVVGRVAHSSARGREGAAGRARLRVVRASSSNAAAYAALRDRGDVHDAFGDKLRAPRRSAASEAARDRRHDRPRRRGGASARPRPESRIAPPAENDFEPPPPPEEERTARRPRGVARRLRRRPRLRRRLRRRLRLLSAAAVCQRRRGRRRPRRRLSRRPKRPRSSRPRDLERSSSSSSSSSSSFDEEDSSLSIPSASLARWRLGSAPGAPRRRRFSDRSPSGTRTRRRAASS